MSLPPLRSLLEKHNLYAKKKYGQHFLLDPNILKRIVTEAGPLQETTVIEVGPGPGGLTRAILESDCSHLIVIEQDSRFSPILEELQQYFGEKLSIIWEDALKVDFANLGHLPRKIIANLPYNISVPLLIKWLSQIDTYESLTLMFQKEVADRLLAPPNSPNYGRLSVMAQYTAHIRPLFDLAPGAFFPPPKVKSSVIQLTPSPSWDPTIIDALEIVTKIAFQNRRKMLKSNFRAVCEHYETLLAAAGISPSVRAESLTIDNFYRLACVWKERLCLCKPQ